jgi:ubiquinone/menaquinone biosynthesis C-methylase UbiE
LPDNVAAFDINKGQIDDARNRLPDVKIETQDIYQLPYDDKSFDLILCLEVLEHLKNPSSALKEIARVASKHLIVSVPSEPFFMLGNLMRGKNILQCGNDQDHVNHWNKRTFHKFLSEEVSVNKITTSFPWLIALCSK